MNIKDTLENVKQTVIGKSPYKIGDVIPNCGKAKMSVKVESINVDLNNLTSSFHCITYSGRNIKKDGSLGDLRIVVNVAVWNDETETFNLTSDNYLR